MSDVLSGICADKRAFVVERKRALPLAEVPQQLEPLLEECRPYYDNLYARAIRATRS